MISLKDEILNFRKILTDNELFTLPLLPKEQQTQIPTLIDQNNAIVKHFNIMSSVMNNYCKLNDKVYGKIIQHELSLHSERAKLNNLIYSLQRKMLQNSNAIKSTREQIQVESKNRDSVIGDKIRGIRMEIQRKCDGEVVQSMVRRMLKEYDQGNIETMEVDENQQQIYMVNQGENKLQISSINNQDKFNQKQNDGRVQGVNKKKKVNYYQFLNLQSQLQSKIANLSTNLDINTNCWSKLQLNIHQQQLKLQIQQSDLERVNQSIDHIQKRNNQNIKELNQQIMQINQTIVKQLSVQAWNSKLQHFSEYSIKPALKQINKQLQNCSQQIKNIAHKVTDKLESVHTDIVNLKNSQINYKSIAQELRQQTNNIKEQLTSKNKIQKQQIANITKQFKQFKEEVTNTHKQYQNWKQQIHNKINKISMHPQSSHSHKTNLEQTLKYIETDIIDIQQQMRHITSNTAIQNQQITNIKLVLGQKANYADLILQVQKKVDREDLAEIRNVIKNQSFLPNSTSDTIRPKGQNGVKRVQSAGRSIKNLLCSQSTNKTAEQSNIFQCGINVSLQNSRRKVCHSRKLIIKNPISEYSQ